jgi:hypothetical protein
MPDVTLTIESRTLHRAIEATSKAAAALEELRLALAALPDHVVAEPSSSTIVSS